MRPNTITDRAQVNFSAPFFISGTQLLVKSENSPLINLEAPLADLTIGLVQGTTTEELIASQYPSAEIRRFQGVTGRTRGVQALNQDVVDAFASDGILLLGEVSQQRLSLADYQLVPDKPITCDYYGMILPQGDPQWKALVDSVIQSPQAQRILSQGMSSYLRQVENYCPS